MRVALDVRFNPFVREGSIVVTGATAWYRHFSEFALHAAGARWHPNAEHCPTVVDGECRCMLGVEA